jgi:hypothetical protein
MMTLIYSCNLVLIGHAQGCFALIGRRPSRCDWSRPRVSDYHSERVDSIKLFFFSSPKCDLLAFQTASLGVGLSYGPLSSKSTLRNLQNDDQHISGITWDIWEIPKAFTLADKWVVCAALDVPPPPDRFAVVRLPCKAVLFYSDSNLCSCRCCKSQSSDEGRDQHGSRKRGQRVATHSKWPFWRTQQPWSWRCKQIGFCGTLRCYFGCWRRG